MKRALAAVLLLAVVFLGPGLVDLITRRDEPAPVGLRVPISDFGTYLARSLDRPLGRAWFVGAELRAADRLTILYFTLDGALPWLPDEPAFLASRCVRLEGLIPEGMSGGIMTGDVATDTELQFLRSEAQGPCPAEAGRI